MYSWCPAYSSLLDCGITSIYHLVEVHLNANLSCLSQAIDIITHKSALPLSREGLQHLLECQQKSAWAQCSSFQAY